MDHEYWDAYYRRVHPELARPSSFATVCNDLLASGTAMFELGCGNGRDALYFARRGHSVLACDSSSVAIGALREHVDKNSSFSVVPRFIHRPFENLDDRHSGTIDVVYSRFTLHAVPREAASAALRWAARNVTPDGRFFAEARSVLGSLYGKGIAAGGDAFIHDGHYRRFIRRDELVEELEQVGFRIDDVVESDGLAVFGDDDPVVIRVFATRSRS